jgi:O-antigen ligase
MSMRTTNARAPRFVAAADERLALGAATVLGVGLVAIAIVIDGGARPGSDVAMAVGALACMLVALAGPVPCLMAIASLTAAGLSPSLIQLGGIDLKLVDVFFAALVVWWLWESIGRAQRVFPERPRVDFGQLAALAFLGYAGLSLWQILNSGDASFSGSLISWIRLVQTFWLAWIAATVLRTKRDIQLLIGSIAVGAVAAVGIAVAEGGVLLIDRSGGTLGPDTLGLVATMLIVIATFGLPKRMLALRIALILVGVAGLLLGKSVGSAVAIAIALPVGTLVDSGAEAVTRVVRGAVVALVAGGVAFGIVHATRPEQIPGSSEFTYSSTYSRIVVGAAGLEIFEQHPVIGVGWRGSNSPAVIGDRDVNLAVRRQLPDANPIFYPDVTPTSVHNTYIQILADLGLVGFGLMIWLLVTLGLRTRALLRALGRRHELWPMALVSALGLLLAVVWYNDNPLYGGQPETVLPALFVAILVAIAQMTAVRPAPVQTLIDPGNPMRPRPAPAFAGAGPAVAEQPLMRPGASRRIGLIAAIILASAGIGLVAGWGTAPDKPRLTPSTEPVASHFDKVVRHEFANLERTRASDLGVLTAADTPTGQQGASIALAQAYETTAATLAQAHPPADERDTQTSLVARLREVAIAYRELASAAANVDTQAYDAARRAVERAEAKLPPPLGSNLPSASG